MNAVLTGCCGGIGRAIAERLARAGYHVVGLDVADSSESIPLTGFYRTDLRDVNSIRMAVKAIINDYNQIWALVYCAGIYPIVSFQDYTIELWDNVHQTNVRGAFMLAHGLVSAMGRSGRMVFIASGAAHVGSRDTAYSSSKAGLVGLTKSLALQLAGRGILVNAVCPGPIVTAMSERMAPDHRREYEQRIPLGRFGEPSEVACVVEFLLAADNSYMTGATIDVNGGLYCR